MEAAAMIFGLWFSFPTDGVLLSDIDRFPAHEEPLAWGDRHVAWLESQLPLDLAHRSFWLAWYDEAKDARQPWRELMLARQAESNHDWRIRRLRDLRDLIGPEAYSEGRMPSVVPLKSLWRFREVR